MEPTEHTIVQDPEQLQQAVELSLQAQPELSQAPELPGYILHSLLGRGSFGEVWEATQTGSGQKVAVKVFTQPGGLDFRLLQHEIKRLRQVAEHPHVVTLHDADFLHQPPYFCMGLYRENLSTLRKEQGELAVSQVISWFHEIAAALKFTHEKGLLHCDLKPANVLLDDENRAKVADFGQAVERGLPGSAVGSLGYMAPEQASLHDSSPDVQWDIYGLGATIYFLLTGRAPRLSDASRETMGSITDPTERLEKYRQVISTALLVPVRELNPHVDQDLADLVTACLALDQEQRPQSVAEVIEDLHRREGKRPLLCRRPWPAWYRGSRYLRRNALGIAVAGLVLVSSGAAVAGVYQRSEEQRKAMALQEFDMGWKLAQEGRAAQASLWWARSLHTDLSVLPAQAALDSVTLEMEGETFHGSLPVSGLAYSRDGHWLASVDTAGTVRLWRDGEPGPSWQSPAMAISDAYSVSPPQLAFTPDGEHLLTASGLHPVGDPKPKVPFTGQALIDPQGRGALVFSQGAASVFAPRDGRFLPVPEVKASKAVAFGSAPLDFATLGEDGSVTLFRGGRKVAENLHQGSTSLAFSADGRVLVTCSEDRKANLWDAESGEQLHSLDHGWWVINARFSDDGKRLTTTSYNGQVRQWDVMSGLPLAQGVMRHSWLAYGTTANSNGSLFASYGVDGKARVWQSETGVPYSPWFEHGSAVRSATFSPDDRKLVTAGQNGTLRFWKVQPERSVLGSFQHGQDEELLSVSYDPLGELVATSWQRFPSGGGARIWRIDGTGSQSLTLPDAKVFNITFSPDGGRLATAGADGTVRLFDREGLELQKWSHQGAVNTVAFSPDGNSVLSAGDDGKVRLWGESERTFQTGAKVIDAKMSADGRLVGAACSDGKAFVWNSESGEVLEEIQHPAPLRRIVFSKDGDKVLLCAQDAVGLLLDLRRKLSHTLQHSLYVSNGSFDSSGSRVVTTSLDGALKVWNAETGEALPSPSGHEGPVLVGQFSPDDSLILSVSKDGTAQLWESETGLPFGLPIRHNRLCYDGQFSSDGRSVLTGSHDGLAKITAVPSPKESDSSQAPELKDLEARLGFKLQQNDGRIVCEPIPAATPTSAETR